ncbi:hypothetical protein FGG08_003826 [Glutinoglossum americanum]|uniref:C2 domain containing protein n=1 Tax=Glutinoglossum americanum TaxID=1670608 RepID=A0A9P8KXQ2_9PEZI|nr:hypothetical protein FGG08_003826 [Glutinoglossum americanum]
MSTSSSHSRGVNRRLPSGRLSRTTTTSRNPGRRPVSYNDAYLYALRVAYLAYLLQPRTRRTQHVPAPQQANRSSTSSVHDLMKDFSLVRDSKSTRLPHNFLSELEKRLTGVLTGKERRPEYNDPAVKRTFAVFYNAFTEKSFRSSVDKSRRVEDLVLIFVSHATRELRKDKPINDDSYKLMVDRHVALFVRLINSTLKDHGWISDRAELANRLATLESKLLVHDQNLTDPTQQGGGGTTIEVVVPLSYEVKDMPLVQTVARIFGLTNTQVQSDINKNKSVWTEKALMADLKAYNNNLNLNAKTALNGDDFDLQEAFETWRKAEIADISQIMWAIIQSNPGLAKSTPGGSLPQLSPQATNESSNHDFIYSEMSRKLSDPMMEDGSYVFDQPVDMSSLNLSDSSSELQGNGADAAYTFIPPDPRSWYRFVLQQALSYDLRDKSLQSSDATTDAPPVKLLSKQSMDLLNELCLRWRIPLFSRMPLFLDAIREKYMEQEIDLDTLDAAFNLVKEAPKAKPAHSTHHLPSSLTDMSKWTIADFALNRQILSSIHDTLLRDLYEALQHCYQPKPPSIGPVMYILENHIYNDPLFSKSPEELDRYVIQLREGLKAKAADVYREYLEKEIPLVQDEWEFYHIIQLGKAIIKLADRIKKRYKKNPEILGQVQPPHACYTPLLIPWASVNPYICLVETVFPAFGEDSKDMIGRILLVTESKGEEVGIQDGFDLYKDLVEIRRMHTQALPNAPFAYSIEELLVDFVWRWIHITDSKIGDLVDEAVKQDNFEVRTSNPQVGPSDEERHSVSVIDIFRLFNQTIDQVVALNWDNDLQYAKFMTALARTIGSGIARYCEIVEGQFAKEMDRMTPEQEAVARQSRQERWVQIAKDAWNNKEKIEPFQFFPESFVKLNNTEFATYQLDQLEKNINVDACAAVVQRHTPPLNQRQRKVNNYIFTIKIVEAEDLKACDINGLSDPYVVLGDEYQKRLAKTRIIYSSLNPRWDETVDIKAQGPLNIIATVWDWDTLGDHDCVGRTSIKLDPAHFSDYMPREYWLDLDTQGRLLLRVSMEGERDDIQFYFGKAFRTLKRTERDMTRKITDKLSAYIHHCLSRSALRSLLSTGITMSSVSSLFSRNRPQSVAPGLTQAQIISALTPLFTYFDDNFAIMQMTLTSTAMRLVMTRLWKEVLVTIEALLVPPLSDKPSQQKQLTQQELDIVFKWLQLLFDFFQAVDDETGEARGVAIDVLKSPKYHDIQSLNFFYFETTENLIRISERMASATATRQQQQNRLSAPSSLGGSSLSLGGASGLLGTPSTRRSKSIMLSRNLGTMRKAKEEKRKEAQAEPNDDMILRILRMRPEAANYLRDRSRQKERLAAAAAAEMIVRQSMLSGGGRMAAMTNLPRR